MPTERLDPKMSEADRRALVKRIAERGTRTDTVRETTKKTAVDYSAAAAAAMEGDPVSLPPGSAAEAAVTNTVTGPSNDASRYADAQAEIFKRGQGREGAAGQAFLDDTEVQVEATNYALDEYEAALTKQAAEQAASSRRSSYSPSGPASFDSSLYGDTEEESAPVNPLEGLLTPNQIGNFEEAATETGTLGQQAESALLEMKAGGLGWEEIRNNLTATFRAQGIEPRIYLALLSGFMAVYFPGDRIASGVGGPGPGGRY